MTDAGNLFIYFAKWRNPIKISKWNRKNDPKEKYEFQNPEESKNPITVTCRIQIQLLNFFCIKYKTIYLRFTQNAMHKMKWSRNELHRHRIEGAHVAHKSENE